MCRCWWIYYDCDASVLQILTVQFFGKFYFILFYIFGEVFEESVYFIKINVQLYILIDLYHYYYINK